MAFAKSNRFDAFKPFPESASQAEQIAHQADQEGVCDWTFRRPILQALPDRFAIPAAKRYTEIHAAKSRSEANLFLLDTQDDLSQFALSLSASDDDLISYAKSAATRCAYHRKVLRESKAAYEFLISYITNRYSINPPLFYTIETSEIPVTVTDENSSFTGTDTVTDKHTIVRNVTVSIEGMLNRFCDEYWWRRMLRNITSRNVEKYSIDLGLFHRYAGIYISEESMQRRRQQKSRNKRAMESCILTNELGQEFTLLELAENSLANPANRRAELMVRIRGTEEVSKSLGHKAVLYTITTPSRMHARWSTSGKANPKYDGTTPIEAQQYLTKLWAQIRAQLARDGIMYYGFRVVEPHHDGTPHWHLLLFMAPQSIKSATNVLRTYAMREDGNEQGAAKHRFTAVKVDPKKGSATGYIAKYISKSIDGYGIDEDLYGYDAKDSAKRISTWASVWGIRQFQQLGGPPVTLYRELRRIQGNELSGLLLEAWQAADKGDWETFIKLMGGPNISRKDYPLTTARLWSDEPNRYLEPKGFKIIGVNYGNVLVPTRLHQWTVTYLAKQKDHNGDIEGSRPPDIDPSNPIHYLMDTSPVDSPLETLEFCQ